MTLTGTVRLFFTGLFSRPTFVAENKPVKIRWGSDQCSCANFYMLNFYMLKFLHVKIFTCQNFYMSKFDRPKLPLISGLAVRILKSNKVQ